MNSIAAIVPRIWLFMETQNPVKMSENTNKPKAETIGWMKNMTDGQLTRDPSLKTMVEIEKDQVIEKEMKMLRRQLFPSSGKPGD